MHKVLVTDSDLSSFEIENKVLTAVGAHLVLASAGDEGTLIREAGDADALLVDRARITEGVVAAAARGGCRAIVRYGIGYENVDLAAAERFGIPVANVPDYCLDEVADHTIALLLAHARGVVDAVEVMRQGGWRIPKERISRLAGRHLGLIGFGRIGRRVAARAEAFGLSVDAYDPVAPVEPGTVTRLATVEELCATADYISLHAPVTNETRRIIDRKAIESMRRAPFLINTSRGELVDLEAVAEGVETGMLSGAALDVFEIEPFPADHRLRRDPRVLLTPHMAYYSAESERELSQKVAEEVARAIRGEPLANAVTRG